jgi:hypothetical protein
MLASTVQFSNNDQPPITPNPYGPSALGPATEGLTAPSDTQQRARHDPFQDSRSTPKQY